MIWEDIKYGALTPPPPLQVYRNCSRPRGLVFIANYTFEDSDLHKARDGSEVDVRNLKELFTQMGYVIPTVHQNLNTTVSALTRVLF